MLRRTTCWLCQYTYDQDSEVAALRHDGAPCLACQQRDAIPGFEQSLCELAADWVRATTPEVPFWAWIRTSLIIARDQGRCDVCGWDLLATPERVRCAQVVGQAAGGTDSNDNLIVLCTDCAERKPVHTTRAEYEAWRDRGGWLEVLLGATSNAPSLGEPGGDGGDGERQNGSSPRERAIAPRPAAPEPPETPEIPETPPDRSPPEVARVREQ